MASRPGREPEIDTRESDQPTVLAVVVTHNGRKWLRESLVALAGQSYKLLDVLVVDDATHDSRQRPQIRRIAKRHLQGGRRWGYLRTPRALGYGGAINWAMSRVRTDADLLLFLHDDAALERRSVEHMVARMEADEETAIVGPKIVAWDEPLKLEEVGMLIDRFGYPYKGLEEDEIDSGQHDTVGEVFYVTSTCVLIRHNLFKDLRGWDARMRAFSEDLDICWRARLAGYAIKVEPKASARHAMGLATGQRPSPFQPARYFIRRNRLRTVFKNASSLRLLAIIPQFILLTFAEMLGFVLLRQPREIANLGRALVWNLGQTPQALSERTKVQRTRKVRDKDLSRLTVGQGKRLRFYISHQRDRIEETWGRRAELLSRRTSQARVISGQLKGWMGAVVVLTILALLLGFRNVWWSSELAVGEILPFPEHTTGVWRAFLSPWRGVGLGQGGPNPPALGLLGLFPFVTLGGAGAAQKVLIATLGVAAFAGAYRLVSDLVDRPGRLVAGAAYMLGPVGWAGIRAGSLGALVFGAAAPWVLLCMVRVAGWARPPNFNVSRGVAGIALGGAISAAFVPGALLMYAVAAVLLSSARAVFVPGQRVLRSALASLLGLLGSWVLLLPWSATWFSEGGPLAVLRGDSWRVFAEGFDGHGVASVVLGQTPEGPIFFGLALTILGVVAVLVAEGQRRRLAMGLWLIVVVVGLFVSSFSVGWLRSFVASPIEAGVLPSVCFAGLAGLAIGAFRLDLPRRGLGPSHWLTLGALAIAGFLFVGGIGPEVLAGGWTPGKDSTRADAEVVAQVGSLFTAEAQEVGPFRALWVGEGWSSPVPTIARPAGSYFVTGSRGQIVTDLFEHRDSDADEQLDAVIRSVEAGATDRGGSLLGAFNIHLVVLERTEATAPWLAQRDLALVRAEDDYLLLQNDEPLPRAGLYSGSPVYVRAVAELDPSLTTEEREVLIARLRQVRVSEFSKDVSSSGEVFIAESTDDGWTAVVDGVALERADGGWGNAFTLPSGDRRTLRVVYPRSTLSLLWSIAITLGWIVVIGAAFSKRKKVAPAPRVPRRQPVPPVRPPRGPRAGGEN